MNDREAPLSPFPPSLRARYLELRGNRNSLATATGFLVKHDDTLFLVTNWHVLSGRRSDTKQPIDKRKGAVPDTVVVHQLVHVGDDRIGFEEREERLVDEDGRAVWYEHPVHGSGVDVGALRLVNVEKVVPQRYDPDMAPYVELGVGDDITVVGYPFGVSTDGLPLWTRAMIASEYEVDYDDRPCFLIDARTRTGQSGSPVIFFRAGGYLTKYGTLTMPPVSPDEVPTPGQPITPGRRPSEPHYTEQFLGVYSGRINDESDIGIVWRPDVIGEIIRGGKRSEV